MSTRRVAARPKRKRARKVVRRCSCSASRPRKSGSRLGVTVADRLAVHHAARLALRHTPRHGPDGASSSW
jgi:hypothetical protein